MSDASLTASLHLEIAQYQASLAKATGEAAKFKEKLHAQNRKGADSFEVVVAAQKRVDAMFKTMGMNAPKVDPWAMAKVGADAYIQKLQAIAKEERIMAQYRLHAAAQAGPSASNPWASGAPAYQAQQAMRAQQAEHERQALMAHQSTLAYREQANPFVGRKTEGFDSNRILAQQAMQQRSMASQAAAARSSGGGNGLRNLGQMSLQFQDIAVQAQMGARASTIIAQQGSQLLSVFGAGGMIAGGAVAIGGAFYSMGQAAKESFQKADKEAHTFDDDLRKLKTGSISEIVTGIGQIDGKLKDATDELQNMLVNSSGFKEQLAAIMGGPSIADKLAQMNRQIEQAKAAQITLGNLLLDQSGKEVEIAALRAKGEKETADEMERQLKLSQELGKIAALPVAGNVRAQLSTDATSRSESAAVKPRDLVKDKEEIAALDERIADLALKQLDPADRYLALAKQQEEIFEKMATTGGAFFEQNMEGLAAWAEANRKAGDAEGAIKVLKQLEKAKKIQDEMAAANKETQQQTVKSDEDRDKEKAEIKRIQHTRDALSLETKIAREQARAGKDDNKTIAAFRDELNVKQLTAQLQDQLKIGEKEALKIAKEKVGAERDATEAIKAQSGVEKARKQLGSRQALAADMKVDSLRAAGKDAEADKLEKRIKLMEEIKRIHDETGLSEQQAAVIAKQRLSDQERAADRAARAAGLSGADGPPRKIKRKDTEDQDPNDRYGLTGRPSGPLANVGGLASNTPLTKHGGVNGFWDLQTGRTGMRAGPSARGEQQFEFGSPDPMRPNRPLDQVQQQNANNEEKTKGGGDWQAALIARLKTEMAPAIAEAMAAALLQKS